MDVMDTKLPSSQKSKKEKRPTLRFEIDLPESTNDTCPDYSYIDLVHETLKEKHSKGENATICRDLLVHEAEKERNETEALAQYFEIQYGCPSNAGHKHKRKDRIRDLVDAGYGYDENDPFVDDSEAYDEIVPASLTTQHGGFYINIGRLNFREVSDQSDIAGSSSDDSMPLSHHASKKKSKMKTSATHNHEKSADGCKKENCDGKKKRKKKLKHQKDDRKKRKISCRKEKVNLNQSAKKINKSSTNYAQKLIAKAKAQQMMTASFGTPVHPANSTISSHKRGSSEEYGKPAIKETTGLESIHDKDLSQGTNQATKKLMNVGTMRSVTDTRYERPGDGSASSGMPKFALPSAGYSDLPPGLPQLLGDKIESLKKLAKSAEGEGKQKFFSSDVNRILLGIEEGSQNLRAKVRNGMYQHIANHLPCSKDTLMKRLKKLQVDDCDQQIKGPVEKLRVAVDAVMTVQIQQYVSDCAAHAKLETKFGDGKPAGSTDEDDDCVDRGVMASLEGSAGAEKTKRTYAPRRKFKWDDNLRSLLCDVVRVKMNAYERFKVREKQTPEEYLKVFLETVVKPLWPKPWMQARVLFKESQSVHSHLTNSTCWQKQKKVGSGKKVAGTTKEGKLASSPKNEFKFPRAHEVSAAHRRPSQQKTSMKQLMYDEGNAMGSRIFSSSALAQSHLVRKQGNKSADVTSNGVELVDSVKNKGLPVECPGYPKLNPHVEYEPLGESHFAGPNKNSVDTTAKPKTKPKGKNIRPVGTEMYKNSQGAHGAEHFFASDWLKMATSLMMGPSSQSSPTTQFNGSGASNLPASEYGPFSKIVELKPDHMPSASRNPFTDKLQFRIASSSKPVGHLSELGHLPPSLSFPHMADHQQSQSPITKTEGLSTKLHVCGINRSEKQCTPMKGHPSLHSTSVISREPRERILPTVSQNQQRSDRSLAHSEFTIGGLSTLPQSSRCSTGSEMERTASHDLFNFKVASSHSEPHGSHVLGQSAYAQKFSSHNCFKTQSIISSGPHPSGSRMPQGQTFAVSSTSGSSNKPELSGTPHPQIG